jgi:hypothetical protein
MTKKKSPTSTKHSSDPTTAPSISQPSGKDKLEENRGLQISETISFFDLLQGLQSSATEEWEKAMSPIRNFTAQQLTNLKNLVSDLGPSAQKTAICDAMEKIIKQSSKEETFALPSHSIMFTLLAMFAGKPDKIPRKVLEKPQSEWTFEEKKEAEEFLNSIIQKQSSTSYRGGQEEIEEKYIAIVSDNPRVEAKAEITMSLFREDLRFREESLAIYIKRTFGPEGLRHLLGLLIGLEENFRKGYLEWSVNEHLQRLGYRKKPYGSYDPEQKKTASEIIKVFQSLFITAKKKDGKKEIIQGERLFSIDGFRQEIFDKTIIDEKIRIRATDFWYRNAFKPNDGKSMQYTKLLKQIAQENHREHPLTIYLAPLLAIFWRMSPQQKISVAKLMEWCDLDIKGKQKMRDVRRLESELIYMNERGYLGEWTSDGEKSLFSECDQPLNCLLVLTPPNWLNNELQLIQSSREIPSLEGGKTLISRQEFQEIYKKSNLNMRHFAKNVGISLAMMSYLLAGKREISLEVSEKVLNFAIRNQIKGSFAEGKKEKKPQSVSKTLSS